MESALRGASNYKFPARYSAFNYEYQDYRPDGCMFKPFGTKVNQLNPS
jgi:hypothetical protein